MSIVIDNRKVHKSQPVYFIADIASNHGGDLYKAKELIYACAESRVDAVKMQNFSAETIVSDYGFNTLKKVKTHQNSWKTSVFESYKAASIPFEWTLELKDLTRKLGMSYFTSPYSLELVKAVEPYVSALKLGSGDITWIEELEFMASYNKPLLIATGASSLGDVKRAMFAALSKTNNVLLMQCNTNYTAKHEEVIELTKERLRHVNLKVLQTYNELWPQAALGLSDHTHGSLTVLGAVGLYDCCAVEKHFTLDSSQEGQDHSFSMMPNEWLEMVKKTEKLKNELSDSLSYNQKIELVKNHTDYPEFLDLVIGSGIKQVEQNEKSTIIVQRRSIRAKRDLAAGSIIEKEDLIVLRPCPPEALPPYAIDELIGKELSQNIQQGECISYSYLK